MVLTLSRKIDDDLDVVVVSLECFAPSRQRHTTVYQSGKPVPIGARKRIGRFAVVPTVRVDRTKDHVVLQYHCAIEVANVELDLVAARRNAGQTYNTVGRRSSDDVKHD